MRKIADIACTFAQLPARPVCRALLPSVSRSPARCVVLSHTMCGSTQRTERPEGALPRTVRWTELVAPNLAMLVVVDAIEAVAPGLRHVNLMQGYKVYGARPAPRSTWHDGADGRPRAT
jgi:hypothetical protein